MIWPLARHARGNHVAVADRLDLFEVILLDEIVEALEDVVEEIDEAQRAHGRRHRREFDHIGEQDACSVVVRGNRALVDFQRFGDLPGRMLSNSVSERSWKQFRCPTK